MALKLTTEMVVDYDQSDTLPLEELQAIAEESLRESLSGLAESDKDSIISVTTSSYTVGVAQA
jgi:hypothetical protein